MEPHFTTVTPSWNQVESGLIPHQSHEDIPRNSAMPEPHSNADSSCDVEALTCLMHVLPLNCVQELNCRDCTTGEQTGPIPAGRKTPQQLPWRRVQRPRSRRTGGDVGAGPSLCSAGAYQHLRDVRHARTSAVTGKAMVSTAISPPAARQEVR